MIEKLSPESVEAVGVYAAGFRLLDAANMLAFLFGPLLIPMYVRLRNDRMETIQLMQLASGMMVFITGVISIGSFFWSEEIMVLCYGNAAENWITTFRLLILSHIPIGMMYIFGSYLTAMHQMKRQNILFAFSVAINLILNFILIPEWGTKGAATSSLITQSVTTLGLIALSHNFLKEKMNISFVLKVLAYFIVITFSAWIFKSIPFSWYLEMIIFGVIAIFAAFLLKLLQLNSFTQLLKSSE